VCGHDGADDRQAEPVMGVVGDPVQPLERLEQALNLVGRATGPVFAMTSTALPVSRRVLTSITPPGRL
jgi:hypothetical protein